jgi:acylphosphatase
MSDLARVSLKIFGQVQGVYYRFTAKTEAEKLGLFGWSSNNDDGSVEIVAEGEKEQLEKLIDWCKKGSFLAKVEKVDIDWQDYKGEFKSFDII